jgi:hypothetical protein
LRAPGHDPAGRDAAPRRARAANLVATARRGREKLHFLNPVPLQEIYERWIAKFDKPRLKALADLKRKLEKAHG